LTKLANNNYVNCVLTIPEDDDRKNCSKHEEGVNLPQFYHWDPKQLILETNPILGNNSDPKYMKNKNLIWIQGFEENHMQM
jgi:hypothetical protein